MGLPEPHTGACLYETQGDLRLTALSQIIERAGRDAVVPGPYVPGGIGIHRQDRILPHPGFGRGLNGAGRLYGSGTDHRKGAENQGADGNTFEKIFQRDRQSGMVEDKVHGGLLWNVGEVVASDRNLLGEEGRFTYTVAYPKKKAQGNKKAPK
jgi:hypothetical protein